MRKKSLIIAAVISAAMLIIDRLTKYLVVNSFALGEVRPFIKGFINFRYILNTGAAFGILENKTAFFIAAPALLIIFGVFLLVKHYLNIVSEWAVLLIISGGIGNLIDRIFNNGRVIDFIETAFMDFPVFNIADCAVTVGAFLLIFSMIFEKPTKKAEE